MCLSNCCKICKSGFRYFNYWVSYIVANASNLVQFFYFLVVDFKNSREEPD